jgi:beta-phosphoglucomutase-like phosphatase (HAD superfamily)
MESTIDCRGRRARQAAARVPFPCGEAPGRRIEDGLVFEDAPAEIQAAEAAGVALVVVTITHKHQLETNHPTITGYGAHTAALLAADQG